MTESRLAIGRLAVQVPSTDTARGQDLAGRLIDSFGATLSARLSAIPNVGSRVAEIAPIRLRLSAADADDPAVLAEAMAAAIAERLGHLEGG